MYLVLVIIHFKTATVSLGVYVSFCSFMQSQTQFMIKFELFVEPKTFYFCFDVSEYGYKTPLICPQYFLREDVQCPVKSHTN